jgi:RNA polymerase sigma factor (sigma-70 family)
MNDGFERSLDGEALAEVERRLHGRLRAHHLSAPLIDRHLEDAVQKGMVEWLRVESSGEEVRDPKAFVVEAAFRRTIDEVRREARRADGETLDGLLEHGKHSAASAEDVVIESLESNRLQAAIDSLPAEQRQVLALHYFAELDQKGAAQALYMSERTFRRRLKETLAILGDRLGVEAPEQGTLKGLEIGLAAWAGLGGGRVVTSSGIEAPLHSLLDSVRHFPGRIIDRLRGSTTNLIASEVPERVSVIAGGPAGKVIGGCAGAAVVCALSGVVGPGLDLGSGGGQVEPARTPHHRVADARPLITHRTRLAQPRKATGHEEEEAIKPARTDVGPASTSSSSHPARRHESSPNESKSTAKKKVLREPQPTEGEAAEDEFSGIAQATSESTSPTPEAGSETGSVAQAAPAQVQAPPESPKAEASAPPTKSGQAESEFGFEK